MAELLPDLVNLGIIHRVLQNLLREGGPILNLPLILEGVADFAPVTKNPDELSELVRRNLGMYFVHEYETRPGVIRAVTMDPRMEQLLITKIHRAPGDVSLALDASVGRHLLAEVVSRSKPFLEAGQPALLVVSADLRLALRRFLEPSFPRLTVLAYQEIPTGCDIEGAGAITLPAGAGRVETKAP